MIVVNPHFSILYHSNEQRTQIETLIDEVKNDNSKIQFYTSGSTGAPKIILHLKTAVVASAQKTIHYFQLKEKENAALCLPVDHVAGAMMLIRSMIAGLTLHVYGTSTKSIDSIKASTRFIALLPMQLHHAVNSEKGIKALKSCTHILIGGAPIMPALNRKLIVEKISVYHSYGMTETITHIALKKAGFRGVDFYKTLEGIQVSVKNEALCIDYPEIQMEEILTNDRVELINRTSFRWLGRLDYIINSGGLKISPERIEEKISKGISNPLIITGIPDPILGQKLVLILKQGNRIEQKITKAFLCTYLDKLEIPKAYTIIDEFSWTKNDKIDRKLTLINASTRGWKEIL